MEESFQQLHDVSVDDAVVDLPVFHCVIQNSLYVANMTSPTKDDDYHYFGTAGYLEYEPFCDDFGPMDFASMVSFVQMLCIQRDMYPAKKIVYLVPKGRRPFTNAVFLLGTFLITQLKWSPEDTWKQFAQLGDKAFEDFRDATHDPVDFGLSICDCWLAIKRAMDLGWITPSNSRIWGKIDMDEYQHYKHKEGGNFVQVVPGRFIAFKGPQDLDLLFEDDESGHRVYSPEYYADVFERLNVRAIVQLHEAQYDTTAFEAVGISHHDLCFADGSAPPRRLVSKFFRIVDEARGGAVAIHCRAGRGRSGTLIALDLMRSSGFTAREAIAWVRIMRPGSVMGEQQHYLCKAEPEYRASAASKSASGSAKVLGAPKLRVSMSGLQSPPKALRTQSPSRAPTRRTESPSKAPRSPSQMRRSRPAAAAGAERQQRSDNDSEQAGSPTRSLPSLRPAPTPGPAMGRSPAATPAPSRLQVQVAPAGEASQRTGTSAYDSVRVGSPTSPMSDSELHLASRYPSVSAITRSRSDGDAPNLKPGPAAGAQPARQLGNGMRAILALARMRVNSQMMADAVQERASILASPSPMPSASGGDSDSRPAQAAATTALQSRWHALHGGGGGGGGPRTAHAIHALRPSLSVLEERHSAAASESQPASYLSGPGPSLPVSPGLRGLPSPQLESALSPQLGGTPSRLVGAGRPAYSAAAAAAAAAAARAVLSGRNNPYTLPTGRPLESASESLPVGASAAALASQANIRAVLGSAAGGRLGSCLPAAAAVPQVRPRGLAAAAGMPAGIAAAVTMGGRDRPAGGWALFAR